MMKPILIAYTQSDKDQSIQIPVSYEISHDNDLRTIFCTIEQKTGYPIPMWLRPFKFQIKSLLQNGKYETLYSDDNNTYNLDATLFIDKASENILSLEASLDKPASKSKKRTVVQ